MIRSDDKDGDGDRSDGNGNPKFGISAKGNGNVRFKHTFILALESKTFPFLMTPDTHALMRLYLAQCT